MKKYDEAKIGTIKGELLEPVSSIYSISNKYYFPEDIREELHGKADTFPDLDPLMLKRLKKEFESKDLPAAYELIKRYEEEYNKRNS